MPVRVRSRGPGFTSAHLWDEYGQDQSCSDFQYRRTAGGAAPASGWSEVMTDYPSKGSTFHAKRRRGEFVMSPMMHSYEKRESFGQSAVTLTSVAPTCTSPLRYAKYYETGALFGYMHGAYVPSQMLTLLDSGAMLRLQTEVRTRALAERGRLGANLIESFAEMDQVWHMLRNPLENIRHFSRDFVATRKSKSGLVRRGVNKHGDWAELGAAEWLRYRYGIRPLMEDIKAAFRVARTAYSNKPETVRTRASGALFASDIQSSVLVLGVLTVNFDQLNAHRYDYRVTYVDQITRSPWRDLGLTPENLLVLPWELTRMSFVADWFVNIGDVLYANVPRVNLVSKGGCGTYVDDRTVTFAPTRTACTSAYTLSGSATDMLRWSKRTKERRLLGLQDSGLVIKADFRLDHFNRAADALALMLQQLGSLAFYSK